MSRGSEIQVLKSELKAVLRTKERGLLCLSIAFLLPFALPVGVASAEDAPAARTPEERREVLLDPEAVTGEAPEQFRVRMSSTEGDFVVEVTRAWAPKGADRFYHMVDLGFYDEGIAFHRVVREFAAQFGIHGDTEVSVMWRLTTIADEPRVVKNERGTLSFAMTSKPNSRSTQMFINLVDNFHLDKQHFVPFGRVVEGMDVVDQIYVTGESKPKGRGPLPKALGRRGNGYLLVNFPDISYITKAVLIEAGAGDTKAAAPSTSSPAGEPSGERLDDEQKSESVERQ